MIHAIFIIDQKGMVPAWYIQNRVKSILTDKRL